MTLDWRISLSENRLPLFRDMRCWRFVRRVKAPRDPRHPPREQRPDDRALETMIAVRRTTEEAGGAGSSSNDGSAVSRTPGLLGQLRQCRWRPGTRVYIELCRARQGHC